MMSSNRYVVVVERKLNEEPMRGFRDQSLLIHGSSRAGKVAGAGAGAGAGTGTGRGGGGGRITDAVGAAGV